MFCEFETDGSGTLDPEEMMAVAPSLSLKGGAAGEWFRELGVDGTGEASAGEFLEKYKQPSVWLCLLSSGGEEASSVYDFASDVAESFTGSGSYVLAESLSVAGEIRQGAMARAFKEAPIGHRKRYPTRMLRLQGMPSRGKVRLGNAANAERRGEDVAVRMPDCDSVTRTQLAHLRAGPGRGDSGHDVACGHGRVLLIHMMSQVRPHP